MNPTRIIVLLVAVILLVLLVLYANPMISVSNITYKTTSTATGISMDIKNNSPRQLCLTGARLLDDPQAMVEIHQTVEPSPGFYKMQKVDQVCTGPFGTIKLKPGPGGYHIMIMKPLDPKGKTLELEFNGGKIKHQVKIP